MTNPFQANLASTAVASFANYRTPDPFDGYEDQTVDFFDQFVTFDPDDDNHDLSASDDHSGSWTSHPAPAFSQSECNNGYNLYSEESGRAARSDTELLNFEGISLLSPVMQTVMHSFSLPSSPKTKSTASSQDTRSKQTKITPDNAGHLLRSPIRKTSQDATSRTRPSEIDETWEADLARILNASSDNDEFQYQLQRKPLSPPPSARVSNASDRCKGRHVQHCHAVLALSAIDPQLAAYTPAGTPALDETKTPVTPYKPSFGGLDSPVTPHYNRASTVWSQVSGLNRLDCMGHQHPSTYVCVPDSPPVWWSHASSAPLAQPSPNPFHRDFALWSKSIASHLQHDVSEGVSEVPLDTPTGLMIMMDGSTYQEPFITTHNEGNYASPITPQHMSPHTNQSTSRFTTPSPSPRPSQGLRNRQTTAIQVRKQRKRSEPSISKTTSTSTNRRKASKASVSPVTNFVNYTPNDGRKLLSGVAPSGSSRTKARREKEAKDRRREISEAALRAVIEAGGDVEGLVEQGFFL